MFIGLLARSSSCQGIWGQHPLTCSTCTCSGSFWKRRFIYSVGFPAFCLEHVDWLWRGSITVDWLKPSLKAGIFFLKKAGKAGIHPGYNETVANCLCGCSLSLLLFLPHCRISACSTRSLSCATPRKYARRQAGIGW